MRCPQCQTENSEDSKFCRECASPLPQVPGETPSFTHTMKPPVVLTAGSLFADRYRIIEELGSGGMGRVYRVHDEKLDEEVVLKLIRPDIAAHPSVVARFRNELKTARRIGHPHVGRTFDLNEAGDAIYMTMEYVRGEDLKKLIRKVGKMSAAQTAAIARQICSGLSEAHKLGIVHRDLKPQNIMMDENGKAMIVDFGIARSLQSKSLTGTGIMIGTPEYMAPEQTEGEEVTASTDLYALGVILYEMVTGKPPFKGNTPVAVAMKHKSQPPPDPRTASPQISESLSQLILRLLAKDPAERPQSAAEVQKELTEIENSLSEPTPIPVEKQKPDKRARRFPSVKAAAAALILVIGAAASYFLFLHEPPSEETQVTAASSPWENSIAVLPFRDLSPKKDQEHISFAMTEALSDRLSRIKSLKVSSPTSVMRYRNTEKDIKAIGNELGVSNLVEGSIQIAQELILVRGQLTDASTGFTLWSDTFEREMKNIFELQNDVSQNIAQALEMELSLESLGRSGPQKPDNLAAYEAYVRGMNHFSSRYMFSFEPRDFEASVEMIKDAIEIDPDYAEAYAGLGWIYIMNFAGYGNPEDRQKASEYAEKAYRFNPDSGIANAVYGISVFQSGNNEKAYQLLKRSLDLNPNQAESQFIAGVFLRQLGLAEPAFTHFQKAIELNPFIPIATGASGMCKAMSGETEKALLFFDRHKERSPRMPVLRNILSALMLMEEWNKAREYADYAENKYPDHPGLSYSRALLLAAQGETEKALSISRSIYIYAILKMKEETLAGLEKAVQRSDRAFNYLYLKFPLFDFLREEPRFQRIIEQRRGIYEKRLLKYGDL